MTPARFALFGAQVFDGARLMPGHAVIVEQGHLAAILPEADLPAQIPLRRLAGGTLAPGFVDLQVNGGGGVMFNDAPAADTVSRIAEAHAGLGTLALFVTLITDTPLQTRAAVDAVAQAAGRVPGICGLHLEGPHLSIARKGAHDRTLIRPMSDADLAFLQEAARRVPRLLVTLAPEVVTGAQIAALAGAGVIVSLGHSDANCAQARAAAAQGARMVTHLFNAMSPLGHREPGMVGAALADGGLDAGLIADGVHVDPAVIAMALSAKAGPGEVFLVTDAMAPAGSDIAEFTLNGRVIRREGGRLTLADGTLAGADVDMASSIRVLVQAAGVPLIRALAMATRIPALAAGLSGQCGVLAQGRVANLVHLDAGLRLAGVWRAGAWVAPSPGPRPDE